MKARNLIVGAATALFAANGAFAQDQDVKVDAKLTFAAAIPNIPGKSLKAVLVTYGPGRMSPPHTHAKSAYIFAYVLEGQIRSQVNGGPTRVYNAGESFTEDPGAHHGVSQNASETTPAKLLAVFVVDTADTVLTTPDKK